MVFFWCFGGRKKDDARKKLPEEAENLEKLPSWDAPDNTLLMQAFEWYVPDDQGHWRRLRKALPDLKDIGVDNLWIPPGCKAMRPSDTGYEIYDLYDLGEFEQKGSRATKWGPREELESFSSFAENLGIGIYWDAVLNHKAGADCTERFQAVQVDPEARNIEISPPEVIEGWVGFDFPGRGNVYSSMKYGWHHFSAVDWDDSSKKNAIYKIVGENKGFAQDVSDENGNYDYLMFADLDYSNPEVKEDVLRWGEWIVSQLRVHGMRLDACKHYSAAFQKEFIRNLRATCGQDFFFVGEYWKGEVKPLLKYLDRLDYSLSLFDIPLVGSFSRISRTEGADLRRVFDGTLVQLRPQNAVTFVANHDTQPSQSLEVPIASFFKPLAYSLILLRKDGQPCIFYGDLYGIRGGTPKPVPPSCNGKLPLLTRARKLYAYGEQRDYFDQRNCIGFVRYGNRRHPDGLACILSNATQAKKCMYIGKRHAGEEWTDILGWSSERVIIDKDGFGIFFVSAKSVSVWVNAAAEGRNTLGRHFNEDIYKY